MHWPSVALLASTLIASGCFQAHSRADTSEARDATGDASRIDTRGDGGNLALDTAARDAAADTATDVGGQRCGCRGREVRCQLPELCCPATQTCEDPDVFVCTGASNPCG